MQTKESLLQAEGKAKKLFSEIEQRNIIQAGKNEKEINSEIYKLAFEIFGIKKYWHERIVRAGKNTLCLYRDYPENITLATDDIIFLDFGPIFEEWEADYGKTYVIGDDKEKHKLVNDLDILWQRCRDVYFDNPDITGKDFYKKIKEETEKMGYIYQSNIGGHLVGIFPHENIEGENPTNYICADNSVSMSKKGITGKKRFWILELHIKHPTENYGAFFEQMLI